MRFYKVLKNEYIFTTIVKVFSLILGFAQSFLLARYLGTELQGTSTYILSIISVLSIIGTFGIHHAYPFFKKKGDEGFNKNRYFSISTFYFILLISFSFLLSFLVQNTEIKFAVILFGFFGYSNVAQYMCLIEFPNRRNLAFLISTIINFIFVLAAFLFLERSYLMMLFLMAIKDISLLILALVIIKPKLSFDKKTFSLLPKLLSFGFFPMISLLLTNLNYRIDVLMLKQFEGIGFSLIGVYSIGISLSDKIALVPDTLMGVLTSKLSKGAGKSEVCKVCRISFVFSLVFCVTVVIVGDWFINIFYGADYAGAYPVVCITAFGSLFIGFYKLIAQYNIVQGKQIRNVLMISCSVLLNVILNMVFIPLSGINGAAIASCMGHFVCGVIIVSWFSHKEKIPISSLFLIQKEDVLSIKRLLKKD